MWLIPKILCQHEGSREWWGGIAWGRASGAPCSWPSSFCASLISFCVLLAQLILCPLGPSHFVFFWPISICISPSSFCVSPSSSHPWTLFQGKWLCGSLGRQGQVLPLLILWTVLFLHLLIHQQGDNPRFTALEWLWWFHLWDVFSWLSQPVKNRDELSSLGQFGQYQPCSDERNGRAQHGTIPGMGRLPGKGNSGKQEAAEQGCQRLPHPAPNSSPQEFCPGFLLFLWDCSDLVYLFSSFV